MFTSARIKLTFWYLLIIMSITGIISLSFYIRTAIILESQLLRIESRLQREWMGPAHNIISSERVKLLPAEISAAKKQMATNLLAINGMIAVTIAGAGYILSGKTLEPIQKAHEAQKRFVADAAHELRTPITAIKTSLEVNLMDKKIDQKARAVLRENLSDIQGLESLTQSLLRLARVNGSRLYTDKVNPLVAITEAVKRTLPSAKKKHITIKLPEKSSLFVVGDVEALTSLYTILLDNAIKYSPKNTSITISLKRQNNRQVVSKVIDQGPGIDPRHLPKIFERFYRADKARSKHNNQGYGLGLSVAKKIIQEHNGSISVQSKLGAGSTFTIQLQKA